MTTPRNSYDEAKKAGRIDAEAGRWKEGAFKDPVHMGAYALGRDESEKDRKRLADELYKGE